MQDRKKLSFQILYHAKGSQARLALIDTPHGKVKTPSFIFCATKAAIKGVSPAQMHELGTQIILSNTYHLMLQPGGLQVKQAGGLQNFTGWRGPMLTDSGGFQIFSLGHGSVAEEIKGKRRSSHASLVKISEEGALFKSYLDGSSHLLTPEKSIEIQVQLGADLIVVLDECTPFHVDYKYTEESLLLSHRWADRSIEHFAKIGSAEQGLYGVVQGGVYPELRKKAADFINSRNLFGCAIGGSLGATKEQMQEVVELTTQYLDTSCRPLHLLGIGGLKDILHGVKCGIDTFDCVHPTRLARHGGALKKGRNVILRNAKYRYEYTSLDEECDCYTCTNFSLSYLNHLFKAKEALGMQLLTIHNVRFMNRFMQAIRNGIAQDNLEDVEREWCDEG